jgi:tRNA 5-methylaminomethyl-2-thiouridine biosynthesis bifunctional protein
MEASGNRAGIFMPLLSKDDNIPTRLTRAAYLFALRHWERLGGIGRPPSKARPAACCSWRATPATPRCSARSRRTARCRPDFAEWLGAGRGAGPARAAGAGRRLAVPPGRLGAAGQRLRSHAGGLRRRACNSASTSAACMSRMRMGNGCCTMNTACRRARAAPDPRQRRRRAMQVPQAAALPLSALRGQVSHVPAGYAAGAAGGAVPRSLPDPAVARRGCSAGATYDLDPDPALSPASHAENLQRLRGLLSDPEAAQGAPLQGRVGFRCIAPDRLPLVGRLPDFDAAGSTERLRDVPRHPGLYALLGYASRGLIWAGWAAELLAAQIEGEPLPLESAWSTRSIRRASCCAHAAIRAGGRSDADI